MNRMIKESYRFAAEFLFMHFQAAYARSISGGRSKGIVSNKFTEGYPILCMLRIYCCIN
jgi:hypothetical protein